MGQEPGIGHPSSTRPVWIQSTDAKGVAEIGELPVGRYYLNVLHAMLIPADESAANGVFDLAAGLNRTSVLLEDMHGVVFACPATAAVTSVNWHLPEGGFDTDPRVIRRLGLAKQFLQDNFADCHVFAHQPLRAGEPVRVGLTVGLSDATIWCGEWHLAPLRKIVGPVFLEPFQGPVRAVVVRLKAGAAQVEGVPFSLMHRDLGVGYQGKTGERITLRHGDYDLAPGQLSKDMLAIFSGKSMRVDAVSSEEFVLEAARALSSVEVKLHYPNSRVLGPLTFYFSNPEGFVSNRANYRPEHGPVVQWLAGSAVSIKLRSIAYEPVDLPMTPIEPGRTNAIEVHLVEK